MRKFGFALQGVLRLRAHAERLARRQMAEAMQAVAAVEASVATVQQALRECDELREIDGPATALVRQMHTGLRHRAWRLQQDLRRTQAALEQARTGYLDKRKELRAIELLRERRLHEWQAGVAAAEQAEMDELARISRAVAAEEVA